MMRRTFLARWLLAFAGAAFVLATALRASTPSCPMQHVGHERSAPGSPHGTHGGPDAPSDSPAPGAPCECLQWCSSAESVVLTAVAHPREAVPTTRHAPKPVEQRAASARARAHILPFAQAPPAIA